MLIIYDDMIWEALVLYFLSKLYVAIAVSKSVPIIGCV